MVDYQKIIKLGKAAGFSDLEIVERGSENLEIRYFKGEVENNETSFNQHFTIKGIYNDIQTFASYEDLNIDEEKVINTLKENAEVINTDEKGDIFAGSKEYPKNRKLEHDFVTISLDKKIELLASMEQKLKAADKRIVNIPYLSYFEQGNYCNMINSKGLDIQKDNKSCGLLVEIVAKEGEDTKSEFKMEVNSSLSKIDVDKLINDCVSRALSMLNAKSVESGTYPIIVENEGMASLFASVASIFSGESAIKKLTPLLDKEGEQIMSDKITIIDAPLKEDATNYEPFDNEGVACYNKDVVKNGKFITFLHDLKSAKYFKTKSTGNSFGGGARGCNLYIKNGNYSKEKMTSSIKKGLMLTSFDGLHAGINPVSLDFSLKTSGFLIENGKITRPVTLIVAAGNFLKMMNDVECIGNDLKITSYGIGSPSIMFKGLSISGN
ncbi:MAG: metallopeptidase TldD-related protein [Bacilli bacterium]